MSGDLERFLQQAAERLKQKMNQADQPAPPPRPKPPVRQAERARPNFQADLDDSEILEAELLESAERGPGPNPLSNLDTRPGLGQHIDLTDERLADRLHEVFDHQVGGIKPVSASSPSGSHSTSRGSEVTIRQHDVSPLVAMFRQADSLRAAFIASEIFARKF